jgi:hypothetical protein
VAGICPIKRENEEIAGIFFGSKPTRKLIAGQ